MRWVTVLGLLLAITALMPFSYAANSSSTITLETDLQILEFSDIYGGHITWVITGDAAQELRKAIGQEYGVWNIDLATASHYFKQKLEPVIEKNEHGCGYLSFVRITRADPLHDDTQGILNDPTDVQGLIGDVNSTAPITLKMIIAGTPVEGKSMPVVPIQLYFAPFYAAGFNDTFIEKLKNTAILKSTHNEIIAGLGSFSLPTGTLGARIIVGEFFQLNSGNVVYYKMNPLESPLILFIAFAAISYFIKKRNDKLREEFKGTLMEKKGTKFANGIKIVLFVLYLLVLIPGPIYIIILAASYIGSWFILGRIYRR